MLWMSRQCRDKDRHAGASDAGRWLWIARSRLCSLGFASRVSLVLAFAAVFFAMAGMMPEEAVPVKFFLAMGGRFIRVKRPISHFRLK